MEGLSIDHDLTGVQGDVANILIALEQHHHDKGWDNTPPTLYALYRAPNRPADMAGYLVAPCRLGLTGHPVREELATLAHALDTPVGRNLPGQPVAHVFVAEAWGRTYGSVAERERETRSLADIPGSVEQRLVVAATDSGLLTVSRDRGSGPELEVIPEGGDVAIVGNMVESLRRIHTLAVAGYRSGHQESTG